MYQQLRQAVAERGRIALATLVAPVPGQSDLLGRKLLITGSGIFGDLGDAALTARMRQQAPEFLLQQEARLLEIAGAGGTAGVFVETVHPVARLLVLGGGHIAQPLVAIASLLEYEITVIDDRPPLPTPGGFPGRIRWCATISAGRCPGSTLMPGPAWWSSPGATSMTWSA